MPLVVKDRVRETSTTAGTGTFTLAGAVTGFQSFSAIGNGNTTFYTIALQGGNEWEVGIGTYTASGTTLSRDTVLESSNSGNLVNFSAGTKDVFVTYPAERSVYTDAAGTAITPATASVLGVASGGTGTSTAFTTGSVVFAGASGVYSQDNTNLFWDDSNNWLGIGTASPTVRLEVYGGNILLNRGATTSTLTRNFTIGGARNSTGNDFATINFQNYDSNSGLVDYVGASIGSQIASSSTDGGQLIFRTSGSTAAPSERMRIDASGNVGINTTAPGSALDVKGTIRLSGATSGYVGLAPAAAAGSTTYTLPSADGTTGQVLSTNGSGTLSWASAGGTTISNDTATSSNVYPTFAAATTGTLSTIYTSNSKLLYKPSTGEFQMSSPIASNGILLNNTTVAASYTIATGVNGMSVGPITVNSGVSVTVSSGQRWLVI